MAKLNLEHFRDILLAERSRLLKSVQRGVKAIAHDDNESESSSGRAHSNHLADQGSDEAEYETQLLLSASHAEYLREIESALERIENGTYGLCEKTGQPINLARLEAIPTARLCIEAQEEEERGAYGT
jgi:DnaK suppressor protein